MLIIGFKSLKTSLKRSIFGLQKVSIFLKWVYFEKRICKFLSIPCISNTINFTAIAQNKENTKIHNDTPFNV